MTETLIVTYRLHEGVDPASFAAWSREVDTPRCLALDVCLGFSTYVASNPEANQPHVVEVITATSAKEWDRAMEEPGHQDVLQTWGTMADESTLSVLSAQPVTSP